MPRVRYRIVLLLIKSLRIFTELPSFTCNSQQEARQLVDQNLGFGEATLHGFANPDAMVRNNTPCVANGV